jgi:TRAP-type C4-dicarboxylate transport system substrate-binding protein
MRTLLSVSRDGRKSVEILTTGAVVLVLMAVICFCSIGFAAAAEKAVTLRYSTLFPPTHKMGVLQTEWGNEVEKRTKGAVMVKVFYAGALTPPDKAYDGAVKGICDVALAPLSYTANKFPVFEVFDYPMNYRNSLVATKLTNEVYNKFKPKEFDEVKVLYFGTPTNFGIHTKKEVKKAEDIAGLKVRASGVTAKVLSRIGVTPVGVPIGEVYDGLSRGVLDGVMSTVESLQGWKFAEVTNSTVEGDSINLSVVSAIVMNKAKWNSLPPAIQAIIEEVNKEHIVKTGEAWNEMDKSAREFALKRDHKFYKLSDEENARWAKAIDPIFDEYVKEREAKRLPAGEVLKFCRERLKELR